MERLTGYENIAGHCHNIPLVDTQLVVDRLAAYEDTGLTPERCAELAAADGVPVIHAHWTNKKEKWHDGETYCSACGAEAGAEYGRYTYLETEYCPQCGARMDEREET